MCGGPLKCGGPCSAEHVRTLVNPALIHPIRSRNNCGIQWKKLGVAPSAFSKFVARTGYSRNRNAAMPPF